MKKNILPQSLRLKPGYTFFLFFITSISQSCTKNVEIELPNSQLINTSVFEEVATANAALVGIYAKMRNNGVLTSSGSSNLGQYADEMEFSQVGAVSHFYNNTLFAAESGVSGTWNFCYRQIYEANAVIEGVTNSKSLPENNRKQLKGEALFIRALLHFYLVNIYGDIPYIENTDYLSNSRVSRTTVVTVYEKIIADLEASKLLLAENYVTAERVRPNRFAVVALLARVRLYTGNYTEATTAASAVINSPLYTWEYDLDKIFLKGSSTTIWQFMPNAAGMNTLEGMNFIFTVGPPSVALRTDFVNAFEAGDQRKIRWIKSFSSGSSTWYHAFKYKQRTTTPSSVEYSILFRLAEQYLIRAEARARSGDLNGAKQDLNLIRNTAGLSNTTAITADGIVADILNQRRFELFTEYGQRFFDLKRSGLLDAVLPASKPGWNTTDRLWPIPAAELISNPNLNPQNQGY